MRPSPRRSPRPGQARAALAVALGLVVLALAGWLVLARTPRVVPAEDGRAIASAFLDELRAGRVEPAWASTTADFKSYRGLEELRRFVARHPELARPAEFVEVRPIDRNGLAFSECVFRPSEGDKTITVLLAREDGAWKVGDLASE